MKGPGKGVAEQIDGSDLDEAQREAHGQEREGLAPVVDRVLAPEEDDSDDGVDGGEQGEDASGAEEGDRVEEGVPAREDQEDEEGFHGEEEGEIATGAKRGPGNGGAPETDVEQGVDEGAHGGAVEDAGRQPEGVGGLVEVRAPDEGEIGVGAIGDPDEGEGDEDDEEGRGREVGGASTAEHNGLAEQTEQGAEEGSGTAGAEGQLAAGEGERVGLDLVADGVADHVGLGEEAGRCSDEEGGEGDGQEKRGEPGESGEPPARARGCPGLVRRGTIRHERVISHSNFPPPRQLHCSASPHGVNKDRRDCQEGDRVDGGRHGAVVGGMRDLISE